jgi:hypothetical protein
MPDSRMSRRSLSLQQDLLQQTHQKQSGSKVMLQIPLPTNPNVVSLIFFSLLSLVYLVVAVIHFADTGDGSMLTILLTYNAAWAGLNKIEVPGVVK